MKLRQENKYEYGEKSQILEDAKDALICVWFLGPILIQWEILEGRNKIFLYW